MGNLLSVIRYVLLFVRAVRLIRRAVRPSRPVQTMQAVTPPVAVPDTIEAEPRTGAVFVPLVLVAVIFGIVASIALTDQTRKPPVSAPIPASPVAPADTPPEPAARPATVATASPVAIQPADTAKEAAVPLPPERPSTPILMPALMPEPVPIAPEPSIARHASMRMPVRRGRGGCGSRGGAGYRLPNGRCASRRR